MTRASSSGSGSGSASSKRSGVGRVLWPIGWIALACGSAVVAYLLFVIVGR